MRALAVLACLLVAAPLAAKDTWTTPHPGVKRLYRTTSDPLRIHALVVDLCVPGVDLRATASSERKRTVSSFGKLVKAEAAVNGDFFSYADYSTSGLAAGNGAKWADTKDSTSSGFVAFGQKVALLSLPSVVEGVPAGATEVVSGRPLIVKDGKAASITCASHYCELHPRTAAGLSADRRTLILAVVDGRTPQSEGVTCKQLGALMAELGADVAINLDGGGSSAMWVSGTGVVNTPSDGSERVVANHLAVHSNGLGAGSAPACVEDPAEEVHHLVAGLDAAESTDYDGDGRADACARAAAGFRCHPSSGAAFGGGKNIADLSNDAGFADAANWSTIRMGDVTGDGRADVCARADDGVRCWPSTGAGFGAPFAGPALSDASGWGKPRHYTTLRMGDIDGDGRADLCARAGAGMRCWRSLGDAFGPQIVGPAWSNDAGWDAPSWYGTIRMADVDGDGRADLCGRGGAGVECWLSDGAGFPTKVAGPGWSDAGGWSALAYWSTFRVADVDGDGRADVCARAAKGFLCHLSEGAKFGPALQSDFLADASGWWEQSNYLTLRLGDIDGDGDLDVCARANKTVACRRWAGSYGGPTVTGPALSDETGWYAFRFFRTLRLADVDGDGRDDVCARAGAGVQCWRSDGAGFPTKITGPEWADSVGWGAPQYYGTLRIATARVLPVLEPPAGGEDVGPPDAGSTADAGEPDAGAWPGDTLEPEWDGGAPAEADVGAPGDAGGGWPGTEDAGPGGRGWGDATPGNPTGGPRWGTPPGGTDDATGGAAAPGAAAPDAPGTGGPGGLPPVTPPVEVGAATDAGCGTTGGPPAWPLLLLALLSTRGRRARAPRGTSR